MKSTPKAPKIALSPVKSSQIDSIGYDEKTKTLAVKFARGDDVYHYPDFEQKDFDKFKGAESIGKHFGAHIKTRNFTKIAAVKPRHG
jgi:hypothetical protein